MCVLLCICVFSAKWVAQGSYLESNSDECTVSLIYTVHLKKPGPVSFDYQYVDNSIFFEFFVSLDPILALKYFCARYFKTSKAAILCCTNHFLTDSERPVSRDGPGFKSKMDPINNSWRVGNTQCKSETLNYYYYCCYLIFYIHSGLNCHVKVCSPHQSCK